MTKNTLTKAEKLKAFKLVEKIEGGWGEQHKLAKELGMSDPGYTYFKQSIDPNFCRPIPKKHVETLVKLARAKGIDVKESDFRPDLY